MYSISQYPYELYLVKDATVEYDEGGNPIEVENPKELLSDCRCQPSGSGSIILGEDGEKKAHNWTIYIPKGIARVPVGSIVSVERSGELLARGRVIKHAMEQLHDRIWI